MKRNSTLYGAALGAALMYLFDPDRGRYRRALVRDQAASGTRHLADAIEVTLRDLRNRTMGLAAELRSRFESGPVSDEVLVNRIRSKIGRVTSHPHAIEIAARNGHVTLSGPVLAHEYKDLCRCVWSVRGVSIVDDKLEVHSTAENVPALQGGIPRRGLQPDVMQENWAPATRAIAGTMGGSIAINAFRHRDPLGVLLGVAGSILLLRALTNKPLKRVFGVQAGRRAVDIQKTINIAAPVEEVFDFWSQYENFPQFMSNVREIRLREDGTSHWIVAGPAGIPVEWDAVTTRSVPHREIAWKTLPGATVEHAGIVRFEPTPEGTRVHVRMSYNPPAGALGHAVAQLFGADPKSEMDADLMRMKTLIESRKIPHDVAMTTAPAERPESLH
jgi:uncharacterized membrane protein